MKQSPIQQSTVLAGLLVSTLTCSGLQANTAFDVNVNSGLGTEQGTLQWDIAGGTNGPNVLSELTYENVTFQVYKVAAEVDFHQGPLAKSRLFFSYKSGTATDGEVQDSDYAGDNRTSEYSRSTASAADSKISGFDIGIGRRFQIDAYQSIIPSVAYFNTSQLMKMSDGVQVVDAFNNNNLGPFRNTLKSSYDATWQGLKFGLNWSVATPAHHLELNLTQFLLNFYSEADWNLRSDFAHPKSFEQSAVGLGFGVSLNYRFQVSDAFSVWLNWSQQNWQTNSGNDTVFFADGTQASGELNGASWKSSTLVTGLVLKF